jgi:hypothetical protein
MANNDRTKATPLADERVKSAIVTGASGGIGRVVAKRLARDGFAIIVNYAGNSAKAARRIVFPVARSVSRISLIARDRISGARNRHNAQRAPVAGPGFINVFRRVCPNFLNCYCEIGRFSCGFR